MKGRKASLESLDYLDFEVYQGREEPQDCPAPRVMTGGQEPQA